jgi:broad specificity phosphatase PhoE
LKKKFWIGLVGAVCVLGIAVSLFGMLQRPSYIYMVRHGRTYANEQGLLMGGEGNAELTQEAVDQAKAVGQALSDVSFGKVYTSTLGRTIDTASYLLEGAGQENVDRQQMEALDDISWGDAEGYTKQEFMEKKQLDIFPDAFGSVDDADYVSPIHAETKYHFYQRFDKGMQQIIDDINPGENVLVVAHSSMQFWLEKQFPELEGQEITNLGVTVIKVTHGKMELVEYNRVMY